MRLLIVEDSRRLAALLEEALGAHGFACDRVMTVSDARTALHTTRYDAIILDLGLPDADGAVLLTENQQRETTTPTLVLTAREGSRSLIDSLNAGADDYLRKPFEMDELIARIRALLRRPGSALGVVLKQANLVYDTSQVDVRVNGERVELTKLELGALEVLLRRAGRVVSKSELEDSLYGFGDEVASNAIEVLIHRVRRKLASAGSLVEIHTLRGLGYLIKDN